MILTVQFSTIHGVLSGVNVEEFTKQINAELRRFQETAETVVITENRTPAPGNALGFDSAIQWVVDNMDTIKSFVPLVTQLGRGLGIIYSTYFSSTPADKKTNDLITKSQSQSMIIECRGIKLILPATQAEIEKFAHDVAAISQKDSD